MKECTQWVIVEGDINDADYINRVENIDSNGWIEDYGYTVSDLLKKVSEAVKDCKEHHNWPESEYADKSPESIYEGILTEDEIAIFKEAFCPYGEYGIHSICSIKIFTGIMEEL